MFRIKTDIRQYRCKNREKVERLIRNWVIRPSDLIFDGDQREWNPIGDHPTFVDLFASLEEAHHNQPETVITDRAQYEEEEGGDGAVNGGKAPGAGILRRAKVSPPKPSADVEGVIRDSDEITIMTEKTFEMLQEEAEEGSTSESSEEITEIAPRPTFDEEHQSEDEEGADADEVTKVIVDREQTGESDSEEVTGVVERPSGPSQKLVIGNARGRHDLPEDVFATAELPGTSRDEVPEADEDSPMGSASESRSRWNIVLDEMPEESEGELTEEERLALRDTADLDQTQLFDRSEVIDEGEQEESQEESVEPGEWSALDPEAAGDEEEDGEDEEIDPDLRDTLDLTEEDPAGSLPEDDTEKIVVAEAVGDFEVDDEALDTAMDRLEATAIDARAAAEEELEEIPVVEVMAVQNLDMVSAGYSMEYPFPIEPSEEVVEKGMHRSMLPEKKRDRYLTRPIPKRPGEVTRNTFDLKWREKRGVEPIPLSWVIWAAVVFVLLVLVLIQIF